MSLHLEELDNDTRPLMLHEFEAEESSGKPYKSESLSTTGPGAQRAPL
jgi:hypothetical protein